MSLHLTLCDHWTNRHGIEVTWQGQRLDASIAVGFGRGVQWFWMRPPRWMPVARPRD